MRRLVLAGLAAALALPGPAAAGGWWTYPHVEPSAAAPGQRVSVEAEILFPSQADARRAEREGGWFAYALRGFDEAIVEEAMRRAEPGDWWRLGGAEAVELAPVEIGAVDSNLAFATVSFVLPELASGTYALMLCSAGCERPLADVVPERAFEVVADAATARLAERARRLEERQGEQVALLAEARRQAREARAELRRLRAERAAPAEEPAPVPLLAAAVAAGALLGAVATLLARRRRPLPIPRRAREDLLAARPPAPNP